MVHLHKGGNQTIDGPMGFVTHILQNILFYVFMFLVAPPAVKKNFFFKNW